MKKKVLRILYTLAIISMAFAIEVDQNELRQTANMPIEFINYTGPHAEVDSLRAIAAIGEALGKAAKHGITGNLNRYAVIHAIDPSVSTGLDADILILGQDARVDHVRNLRVIIAGYLRTAYGYSQKDAATIAHFVTIYNAVYRGDLNMFQSKYKAVVTQNISDSKVGLPLRYDQWPGNTQIVIPLTDKKYKDTISAIDTTSISDQNVVNKMREQDDKDIEVRKNMIDLKERESDAARERADTARQDADAAQQDADVKQNEAAAAQKEAEELQTAAAKSNQDAEKAKQDAEKAKQQAAQSEKEAAAAREQAQKNPNDSIARTQAEQKQQEAAKNKQEALDKDKLAREKVQEAQNESKEAAAKQKDAQAKQKEAENAAKQAEEKAKEADSEKKFADTKEQEAQSDRKDVAADTRKIIEEKRAERKAQDEAAFASALPGAALKIVEPTSMLSEVVLLDLKTGKILKTSSLNTIRGRSLIEGEDSLIAIAGAKAGNQMITLIGINPRTLEMTKQATVPVAEQSLLVQTDNGYCAVIEAAGTYHLARFNENLELAAQSSMAVLPYTAINVTEKGILVQDSKNNIRLLNAETLTEAVPSQN